MPLAQTKAVKHFIFRRNQNSITSWSWADMIGTIVPYFFTITQSNWQLNSKIWKLSKSWCVVFITTIRKDVKLIFKNILWYSCVQQKYKKMCYWDFRYTFFWMHTSCSASVCKEQYSFFRLKFAHYVLIRYKSISLLFINTTTRKHT